MTSAILLSGGIGSRVRSPQPKQYLPLHGKAVILHALEALLFFPFWQEIVIVCDEKHRSIFLPYQEKNRLAFASPGANRQESVFSGIQALAETTDFVCIHDGARPLLQKKHLETVIDQGKATGAAALAIPVTSTIKEASCDLTVIKTLDRSHLWEMQTPQVLSFPLLKKAHETAQKDGFLATDDIHLVERLGHPAHLVLGSKTNLKITTSEDFLFAELLLKRIHGQL